MFANASMDEYIEEQDLSNTFLKLLSKQKLDSIEPNAIKEIKSSRNSFNNYLGKLCNPSEMPDGVLLRTPEYSKPFTDKFPAMRRANILPC